MRNSPKRATDELIKIVLKIEFQSSNPCASLINEKLITTLQAELCCLKISFGAKVSSETSIPHAPLKNLIDIR